jgi:eukaryotic-like serine/threonine-protein kinase
MVECLAPGSILAGRYKVLSEIGRGKLGIVYKVQHAVLDRPVAVKVLFEEVKATDTAFLRFQREAETASSLNHPCVVKIFDFGIAEGRFPFLVMDYVEGKVLGNLLREQIKLSREKALPIFVQICDGMAHAHENGIIHRDLKPDNIFLVQKGVQHEFVQIVDFGIAKKLNDPKKRKLTAEGQVLGTPAFMSPEQIMGKDLDARSDIYSLGCLMYHVLTGRLPFPGANATEVMAHHLEQEPMNFSEACPGLRLPVGLQYVLRKSMKKEAKERHESMLQLKEELTAFM